MLFGNTELSMFNTKQQYLSSSAMTNLRSCHQDPVIPVYYSLPYSMLPLWLLQIAYYWNVIFYGPITTISLSIVTIQYVWSVWNRMRLLRRTVLSNINWIFFKLDHSWTIHWIHHNNRKSNSIVVSIFLLLAANTTFLSTTESHSYKLRVTFMFLSLREVQFHIIYPIILSQLQTSISVW